MQIRTHADYIYMFDHYSKMQQNAKKHDTEIHICGNNKEGKTNATQKFNLSKYYNKQYCRSNYVSRR